ncbi:MAG: four helix bundle protein [Acidobacteriota bacterium]|nr:four helix bundle protein [Acidobacteriota bacterium]
MRGTDGARPPIQRYQDLAVYQRALELHLQVNRLTLRFPKFETYELGSQLRRSSNSVPANLAEGWNNRHVAMYLEGINRAFGELRETTHHLWVACQKGYLTRLEFDSLEAGYEQCSRMLRGLERALKRRRDSLK